MKHLYAPWRDDYTSSTARTKNKDCPENECVFCCQLKENNDDKHFILKRFEHNVIMLNLYPYNAGHVLLLPLQHLGTLQKLTKQARAELIELSNSSSEILQKELGAQGFNIGLNIGKAAGAGIPAHLHMHVLPRWLGDTNFLPTIGQTKQISFDLEKMYQKLKVHFKNL